MNNFNICAEMEDCELSIFFDSLSSQIDFDENFKILEHSHLGSGSYLFYTGFEDIEAPGSASECFDFSECSEKDFRAYAVSERQDFMTVRNVIEDKRANWGCWQDYVIEEYIDQNTIISYMRDDDWPDINGSKLLYESASITGYSQGDYSTVLYKVEPGFLEDHEKARQVFTNLVFDSPIYARATVDGEEIYLDEGMADRYVYDRDELRGYIDKQELSGNAKHWLKENLPDHPEYS